MKPDARSEGATPQRPSAPSLLKITIEFIDVIHQKAGLVREMALRDLKAGHAGHGLGSFWVYAQPLVLVGTYMLIFGVVIGSKMAVSINFAGDYTSYIVIGMVPWLLMSNALGRASNAFSANSNLVKQVVFPIETLPVASIIACFIIYLPSIALMLVYKAFIGGGLSCLALTLPIVLCLHALLCIGLTLLLSVITPFLRDIRELITIYTSVSMYFTPAIYLPEWVPAAVRPVLYFNPFSYVVWVYQDVLFFGEIRHGFAWVVFSIMAIGCFLLGLTVFRRIKPFLGNVI